MPLTAEIAVIGAGPGGLAVALAFSHRGYKVSVFEQTETFRKLERAYRSPRTVDLF